MRKKNTFCILAILWVLFVVSAVYAEEEDESIFFQHPVARRLDPPGSHGEHALDAGGEHYVRFEQPLL